MIKVKAGVRFSVFRREIYTIFDDVEEAFALKGYDAIITCGTEAHKEDDPHTHGFAIDLRSKHVRNLEDKRAIRDWLKDALGNRYTVLLENVEQDQEHFHVQIRKSLWRNLL